MNIQEFNDLKVGDMVKVKCPICHDCGHCYIAKVTDKITRRICKSAFACPSYITTENVIKIDQHGYTNFEFDKTDIVRKIEKPEKRTAYWCKTRDEAEKFLEDCEAWGIKWCGGQNALYENKIWTLGTYGVMFYLRDKGLFVNGDNCMTWSSRTINDISGSDLMDTGIDRYIEYPSGKVLWDRAEEEAKKKAEPVSFKVMCVKAPSDSSFTLGNIYDWVDGTLYGDKGHTFSCCVASTNPDKWAFRRTKFVKVTEEELKAEETLAEAINNLGKAATLADEFSKLSQEAWAKFAKIYADTDSKDCCCKNKCCSCANYKPEIRSGRYPWGVKEVKRPAKVGEYIKIVKEWHSSVSRGKYTNGDIGLVTMLYGVAIKATINGYDNVPVASREYVVLENYIPEVKEVKRPAKVGEYIKIVKPLYTFNQIGDILKVDSIRYSGGVDVRVEDHPRDASKPTWWTDSDSWYYGPDKYVVLENYVPVVKEVDRCAKVGEYIKIVNEWHTASTKGKYTNGDIGLVTKRPHGFAIRISINGHDDVPVNDVPREYVVLENYRP